MSRTRMNNEDVIRRLADMVTICQETGGDVMAMIAEAGIDCEELEVGADALIDFGDSHTSQARLCARFVG